MSRQPIIDSDPLLRDVRDLAKEATPGAKVLTRLLASLRETGFYRQFTSFLYNTTGGINGYDQYGHFLRAALQITPCTTWSRSTSGCNAQLGDRRRRTPRPPPAESARGEHRPKLRKAASEEASGSSGRQSAPGTPLDAAGDPVGGDGGPASEPVGRRPSAVDRRRARPARHGDRQAAVLTAAEQEAGP